MFFITTQPDHKYYEWQIEAQLYNIYKECKYKIPYICLLTETDVKQIDVERLKEKYPLFQFYYFKDERQIKHYQPSIQPFLLKRFFHKHKEYQDQTSIIIDADVVFTKAINFEDYTDKAYLSNTSSYLNYRYIFSKGGDELFTKMCDICAINSDTIKEDVIGGAQYIFQKNTPLFWTKVEADSLTLYEYLRTSIEYYKRKSKDPNNYHPIQIWTASMWAIYYNLVYFNIDREVASGLDFCWPTDGADRWDSVSIFHNAGVTEALSGELFYKGGYTKRTPSLIELESLQVNTSKCSANYVEILKKALVSS